MSGDSFAAAQQRILARQAQRQQESIAHDRTFETSSRELSKSRLTQPFINHTTQLTSLWSTIVGAGGTSPAFRVGQVDAELLDEELLGLLRTQVADGLKYFGPHLQDDWSQEITLILRAILFKLSIWDNDASYGASLQNLRYTDARKRDSSLPGPSRWQKIAYGLITVLGRYAWEKWETGLFGDEWESNNNSQLIERMSKLSSWFSTTHSIAAFTSFLVFLVNGRYRTLTDRLLRLRLVPSSSHLSRDVSFEYLNRQLVWHAITEFLLFILPIVGIGRWRRWLSRAWRRTKAATKSENTDSNDYSDTSVSGPFSFLPDRTCAICYQTQNPGSVPEAEILGANTIAGGGVIGSATTDIVNPYETIPCGCIYCFQCIASAVEAEEGSGWPCLRCGTIVYKSRPWNGDVIVEKRPSANKSYKNVGFNVEDDEASKVEESSLEELDKSHTESDSQQWSELDEGQADAG